MMMMIIMFSICSTTLTINIWNPKIQETIIANYLVMVGKYVICNGKLNFHNFFHFGQFQLILNNLNTHTNIRKNTLIMSKMNETFNYAMFNVKTFFRI